MEPTWQMAGSEGTGQYFVLLRSSIGRIGFRNLIGSFRIRIEPALREPEFVSQILTQKKGWKQPSANQNRYSIVVKDSQFSALLCSAVRVLCRNSQPEINPSTPPLIKDLVSRINDPPELSRLHVFLSYRRADSKEVVTKIYDRLVQLLPSATIFRDIDSISLGAPFPTVLKERLERTTVGLVVIGNQWLSIPGNLGSRRIDEPNDYVRMEIEAMLLKGIPVIPCLVNGARLPTKTDLPIAICSLASRNALPIRPTTDFDHDVDLLAASISDELDRALLCEIGDSGIRDMCKAIANSGISSG